MIDNFSQQVTSSGCREVNPANQPMNIGGLAEKINSIKSDSIKLTYFPNEIKQKIAFNLNLASYNSLRETSRDMRDCLPSINQITAKLDGNASRGEIRHHYNSLLSEMVFGSMTNDNIT